MNLFGSLLVRKVGVLFSTESYGSSLFSVFQAEAANLGIRISSIQSFDDGGTISVSQQLNAFIETGSNVIVVLGSFPNLAPPSFRSAILPTINNTLAHDRNVLQIIPQADQKGMLDGNYTWIGCDAWLQDSFFFDLQDKEISNLEEKVTGMIGIRPQAGKGPLFEDFLVLYEDFVNNRSPTNISASQPMNVRTLFDNQKQVKRKEREKLN